LRYSNISPVSASFGQRFHHLFHAFLAMKDLDK
jgi:hypothetical protein